MGSPPAEDSRSYQFNFTISGSRQTVLRGLRAWVELGLLTPDQVRSIAEVYQLDQPGELAEGDPSSTPAAIPTGGIPSASGASVPAGMGPAYVLWGLALFGICGIHRFYLGRWRTGLLWLCTFGLLGIGQVIDLVLIPRMVQEKNAALPGSLPPSTPQPSQETSAPQAVGEPGIQTEPLAGTPVPVASLPPSWASRMLQNLLAELSVRWLLVLGLFLVVVSSGVLAGSQWEQFSPTAQYGVLLAYTAAFGAGAWWAQRQEGLRLTSQTLEAIALLLLPVNVWALDGLNMAWGIRGVALGLLLGIPLAAWGRVRAAGTGAGYAFYGTLVNFLALSGLQTLWGLGPLGITYLGIVSTVAYTWSRRSLALRGSKLWLLGAAGSLLGLRGLLTGQIQVWQLGLAVALLGWLVAEGLQTNMEAFFEVPGIQPTSIESAPESFRASRTEFIPPESPESTETGSLPIWVSQEWRRAGLVLLGLGWLLALGGLPGAFRASGTESFQPWLGWQLLIISLLGIQVFWRRLIQGKRALDLALLFVLGLETLWAFWQVLPWEWREVTLALLEGWLGQPFFFWPWTLLGIALWPYAALWLSLAARWQSSSRETLQESSVQESAATPTGRDPNGSGFRGLVRPTEVLVLGLGGSLLLLSLPNEAIRFWHFLLGTGILAGWLWHQSGYPSGITAGDEAELSSLAQRPFDATHRLRGWVFLTHAYGVAALLSGIHWLLPSLSVGTTLLVLALLEWVGGVAMYRWPLVLRTANAKGLARRPPGLQVWQRSAFWIGLVLAGGSYLTFLTAGWILWMLMDVPWRRETGDLSWLWLAVPLVLTVAQVLAWPPLEFLPQADANRIPDEAAHTSHDPEPVIPPTEPGSLSQSASGGQWRQGIPSRESLELLAVLSILLAQLLTLWAPWSRLLGLGLGLLLMAVQVWLYARLPYALLTVALGLGLGSAAVGQILRPVEEEWGVAWAALLLGMSLCRYGVKYLAVRLQAVYQAALDRWGGILGVSLLLWSSGTLFMLLVRLNSASQGDTQPIAARLSLALLLLLLAFGVWLWLEITLLLLRNAHATASSGRSPLNALRSAGIPSPDSGSSEAVHGGGAESSEVNPVLGTSVDPLLYGLGWALELLLNSAVLWRWQGSPPVLPGILSLVAAINLGLGILFWIGPEKTVFLKAWGQPWRQLSSFWAGPLIYAGLGWLGSHAQWNELTGMGSLGLSIVFLGLGRRARDLLPQVPQEPSLRASGTESLQNLRPVNASGLLGAIGISFAAYEGWIYFLSQQSGGSFGDGLVLISLLGLILALAYRLCPLWIAEVLKIETVWLGRIGVGNWGLASLVLLPALLDLSQLGENLWLLTGAGLAAYAAWQGRKPALLAADPTSQDASQDATPSSHPVQSLWCYLSAIQWAGILAVSVSLWLPEVDLWVWGGSLACWLGLVYYFLPWERWGWWPDPWQNMALVLPIGILLLTATETNSSNLLLGAVYYAFLSIQRSQVRLGYVSLFLSNWILLDYGWQQEWSSLTLYALPLVGSLLYVAQVDPGLQQSSARQGRHWLRSFSSGALVLVTLLETHGQLWAGFWPVGLGLALGLLGLALQVRAYLFMGTLGFGLGVLRQGWLLVASYSLLLWGIGILLGLLLIWVAANFERRREQLGSWLDTWLGQLHNWE